MNNSLFEFSGRLNSPAVCLPATRFRLLSAKELSDRPPLRWLVKNILPKTGIAAIYGDPGSGKSFLAIDLLMSINNGVQWFGYETETCPVTYLALEAQDGLSNRIQAYERHHGKSLIGFCAVTEMFSLRNDVDICELAEVLIQSDRQDGVLVIDTLSRASVGLDENASKDMSLIIEGASKLQRLVGGLVVLIHHTGKDGAKGPRGHSSFMAALDASIRVERKGSYRTWFADKAKEALDGLEHSFRLEPVIIGWDESATSCVVVPEKGVRQVMKDSKLPQGENQKTVWNILQSELRKLAADGFRDPTQASPSIKLEELIEQCRGRLGVKTVRETERVKEAVAGLLKKGLIQERDGLLSVAGTPENS